jgi:hypothetical protein
MMTSLRISLQRAAKLPEKIEKFFWQLAHRLRSHLGSAPSSGMQKGSRRASSRERNIQIVEPLRRLQCHGKVARRDSLRNEILLHCSTSATRKRTKTVLRCALASWHHMPEDSLMRASLSGSLLSRVRLLVLVLVPFPCTSSVNILGRKRNQERPE